MAVTDLSGMSDLPWWIRQGGPTPAQAGAQSDGNSLNWLNYLQQMFPGMQGGNPADMPSPSASNINMVNLGSTGDGGFPIPPGSGAVTPPAGPLAAENLILPNPRNALTGAAPLGAGLPDLSGIGRRPNGVLTTQPAPLLSSAPAGAQNASLPDQSGIGRYPNGVLTTAPNPNVATANAQPVKGPLATGGGATSVGATSNPRFIGIDRPNAPAQGGPYGPSTGLQGTALNLAGLFGRGGPGATGGPAAAPQGAPFVGSQPSIRGPLASGSSGISMADLYPAAAARGQTPGPFGISSADLYPAAAARQGMPGRQPMNPNQLASAVRQPNWWQNLFGQG